MKLVITLMLLFAAVAHADYYAPETLDPEGITFEIGINWRGSPWGEYRVEGYDGNVTITSVYIKPKKDGEFIPDMELKLPVSGFGYGYGYQLDAAKRKVADLEKTVEEAQRDKKLLYVERDWRYNDWSGFSIYNKEHHGPWEDEFFEDTSNEKNEVVDTQRHNVDQQPTKGFFSRLFERARSYRK